MIPKKNDVLYGPVALKCEAIKTGTWRIKRPEVQENCIGCGQCAIYCPCMSITAIPKQKAVIDYEYCKGCGICQTICKFEAIKMVNEKE